MIRAPPQNQLLLHVGELAERPQAQHHGVVALIDRFEKLGQAVAPRLGMPWKKLKRYGLDAAGREGQDTGKPPLYSLTPAARRGRPC